MSLDLSVETEARLRAKAQEEGLSLDALLDRLLNDDAVTLGRRGGKIGGPARADKLTSEQRSESARKAVQARWARGNQGSDTSRKAGHLCLDCIKKTKNENELRRLTEELQRIVFHRQYRNAARAQSSARPHAIR